MRVYRDVPDVAHITYKHEINILIRAFEVYSIITKNAQIIETKINYGN